MTIRFSGENDPVARLAGRLDANTAPTFERELMSGLAAGARFLVLDFAGVEYVSSAGLRAILNVTRSRPGLKFAFCGMPEAIKEIFDISGLHVIAPIYADQAAARQALAG